MSARNISRFLLLRNCVNFHFKRPCYTYSKLLKPNRSVYFHKCCVTPNRVSSNVSPPLPKVAPEYRHLVEEFPTPKKILWRLLNEAYVMTKNPDIKPMFVDNSGLQDETKEKVWKLGIHFRWPGCFSVEGISTRKHEAETLAYLHACQKMKELGLLDKDNNPLLLGEKRSFSSESLKSAKTDLLNIYARIFTANSQNAIYLPTFESEKEDGIIGNESFWKVQLHLTYPVYKAFESCSMRLREAENIAAAKALLWLEEIGFINNKRKLIDKEEEEKFFNARFAPTSICIPLPLQEKMSSTLHRLNELVNKESILSVPENCTLQEASNSDLNDVQIRNLITDEIYCELSEAENINRSHEMFQKYISHVENSEPNIQAIRNVISNLPIVQKRSEILKLVNENQVVILSGETGCGKTTQVPQYILDEYIGHFKGANCNILISQPRRISAISIAERIAFERGEQVGETVGYHVRLNKNLPKQSGAVLFCTTGMLLRKLCFNSNLEGISHVIVDEVHERSIESDILLILLKRLLEINKKIKVLIMSASFNTSVFSQYFNNCPRIHVPGNMYPVKEVFLEKLPLDLTADYIYRENPVLDINFIANVINYIHNTQKKGAVLCFLPGWDDILAVQNALFQICADPSELKICRAHSRLPHEEQKMIFDPVPDGIRKIILATNVAETSITINDVVYVVDSGLHKGTSFDSERGVASLGTQWITQANVRQRRGRAGRVQNGVCYHLFPQSALTDMEDYPKPEILRMPLESVILDCKLYCPSSKAEDFLSSALQPPTQSSLQIGVQELQMCGVLDENENLTDLGKVVVNFTTHPRLSIALIYASFLQCLDPVLTICAVLSQNKEPFLNTLEDRSLIKTIKQGYDCLCFSDHLAITQIFNDWKALDGTSVAEDFIFRNLLDEQNLNFTRDLKSLFAEGLFEAGIIDDIDAFKNDENICNVNQSHFPAILSVLTAAFYPNVMKVTEGVATKRNKDAVIYSLIKGQKGYIQKDSVAFKEYELPSPWLVYFRALHSEARRMMMTSSVSSVPGICLLLFGGQQLTVVNEENNNDPNNVILMLDNYEKLRFSCTKEEAELLLLWRSQLRNIFRTYIETLKSPNNDLMSFYNKEFLPVLKEIISTPQVPFTKGYIYKFVNNELVCEEM